MSEKKVLIFLQESKGMFTAKEIVKQVGLTYATTLLYLNNLHAKKLIMRTPLFDKGNKKVFGYRAYLMNALD